MKLFINWNVGRLVVDRVYLRLTTEELRAREGSVSFLFLKISKESLLG